MKTHASALLVALLGRGRISVATQVHPGSSEPGYDGNVLPP